MHGFRTEAGSKDFSTELAGSEVNRQTGSFVSRARWAKAATWKQSQVNHKMWQVFKRSQRPHTLNTRSTLQLLEGHGLKARDR